MEITELAETKYFLLPTREAAQESFLSKRGCYRDAYTGQWFCPKGTRIETEALAKLAKYDVSPQGPTEPLPKWKNNESLAELNKRISESTK